MSKRWLLFVVLFFAGGMLRAQDSWPAFEKQARRYYHVIADSSVQNFSCKFTYGVYINFLKGKSDSSYYYPLKLIWTRDHGSYFVLQPLPPQLNDSLRREALTRIQALQNLFKSILADWEELCIKGPLEGISPQARIQFQGDTVSVTTVLGEGEEKGLESKTFTRAGQLGRFVWRYGEKKVINYPVYQEHEGRWLCTGWNNQSYAGSEILNGWAVRMEFSRPQRIYWPIRMDVVAQGRNPENQEIRTKAYVLFLKDFVINENIEVLLQPDTTTSSQQQKPAGD